MNPSPTRRALPYALAAGVAAAVGIFIGASAKGNDAPDAWVLAEISTPVAASSDSILMRLTDQRYGTSGQCTDAARAHPSATLCLPLHTHRLVIPPSL